MDKLTTEQINEIKKCSEDFFYFCNHYIFIECRNAERKFSLYQYQKRLFTHLECNRCNVGYKFRKGGFTTLGIIYGLWLCLFKEKQKVLYYNSLASSPMKILDRAICKLPEYLTGKITSTKESSKKFSDTNSELSCLSTVPKGFRPTFIFLDDAESCSLSVFEKIVSFNTAKCLVLGMASDDEAPFFTFYTNALIQNNSFQIYRCNWKENPAYDSLWESNAKAIYGESLFDKEFNCVPITTIPNEEVKEKPKVEIYRSIFDE